MELDEAVMECQRLAALSGRAIVPGRELGRIEAKDGFDVVLHEGDPALFYVPERCYPLPREYFDAEALDEFQATTLDTYYGRTLPTTAEEIAEQRRLLAERRKAWR